MPAFAAGLLGSGIRIATDDGSPLTELKTLAVRALGRLASPPQKQYRQYKSEAGTLNCCIDASVCSPFGFEAARPCHTSWALQHLTCCPFVNCVLCVSKRISIVYSLLATELCQRSCLRFKRQPEHRRRKQCVFSHSSFQCIAEV